MHNVRKDPYKPFASKKDNTYSSTTTPRRIRGNTIKLMEILYRNGALSFSEIVKLMNKNKDYVKKYLKRMLKYGIIRREEGIYELTERGILILERKISIEYNNENNNIEGDNKGDSKGDNYVHDITNVIYHQNIINFIMKKLDSKYKFNNFERGVVVTLLSNYFNSGCRRKYMLFDSREKIASTFNIDYLSINEVLFELSNKGIIYIKPIMGLLKIGLMKDFIKYEVKEIVKQIKI